MAWPGFGSMRFDSIMQQPKPYIDESGAIGRKRFTSGTIPQQRDVVAQPFEQPEYEEPPEMQSRAYGPQARDPFKSPMSLPGGLAEDRRTEGEKYYEELEKIRTERGPALSAYQKALEEQPTWEQHKPDWKRRLAGALISGASAVDDRTSSAEAVALGRSVIRAPYDTARQEYGNRMKNLSASAKLEQDEIEAKLKSLQAARALGLDYDKFEEARLQNEHARLMAEGKLEVDQGQLGVAQGNLGVNRYQAETGRAGQEQTGRHFENQDVTAAVDSRTRQLTQQDQSRNIDSQITDRAERQSIARAGIAASVTRAQIAAGRNPPSPAEQQTAIDGALRELQSHPRYRGYIKQNGNFLDPFPDDGSDEYRAFWNELTKLTNRRLQTGLPLGPEQEDPEPDVDIIPER